MLYFLADAFDSIVWMKSIYLRFFLGFIFSFFIVLSQGNKFIGFLRRKKVGDDIREVGPETHMSKQGTPTMGGVLITISILISSLLVGNLTNKFMIMLLICMMGFVALGFIDDYKKFTESKDGLAGKKKMLTQGLIATGVWLFIMKFGLISKELDFSILNPLSKTSYLPVGAFIMLIFIMLVITGSSNAVNITDGLDGLVIMPVIIVASVMAIVAYFSGHIDLSAHLNLHYIRGAGEITVFLSTMIGSGLGFLWYNSYPAQIFMGDTGSLSLGGVLGIVSIFLKQEFLLFIAGFIFVIEALSVILQVGSFKLRGKRIFKMAPIHHHFELNGWPETKVTMRFWIISLLCGILAMITLKLR